MLEKLWYLVGEVHGGLRTEARLRAIQQSWWTNTSFVGKCFPSKPVTLQASWGSGDKYGEHLFWSSSSSSSGFLQAASSFPKQDSLKKYSEADGEPVGWTLCTSGLGMSWDSWERWGKYHWEVEYLGSPSGPVTSQYHNHLINGFGLVTGSGLFKNRKSNTYEPELRPCVEIAAPS